jgi:hypothetical protein
LRTKYGLSGKQYRCGSGFAAAGRFRQLRRGRFGRGCTVREGGAAVK